MWHPLFSFFSFVKQNQHFHFAHFALYYRRRRQYFRELTHVLPIFYYELKGDAGKCNGERELERFFAEKDGW